jgi:hypothetical protein
MNWLRHVAFPPGTISSSSARTWLHLGFRLSVVALGLCIVLGVSGWYKWVPVGVMVLCFFTDLPLWYRDKHVSHAHGEP